jgi:hypothetical protein
MNNESIPDTTRESEVQNENSEHADFLARSRSILKRIAETEVDETTPPAES